MNGGKHCQAKSVLRLHLSAVSRVTSHFSFAPRKPTLQWGSLLVVAPPLADYFSLTFRIIPPPPPFSFRSSPQRRLPAVFQPPPPYPQHNGFFPGGLSPYTPTHPFHPVGTSKPAFSRPPPPRQRPSFPTHPPNLLSLIEVRRSVFTTHFSTPPHSFLNEIVFFPIEPLNLSARFRGFRMDWTTTPFCTNPRKTFCFLVLRFFCGSPPPPSLQARLNEKSGPLCFFFPADRAKSMSFLRALVPLSALLPQFQLVLPFSHKQCKFLETPWRSKPLMTSSLAPPLPFLFLK